MRSLMGVTGRSLIGVTGAAALVLLAAAGPVAADNEAGQGNEGFTIEDPRITESSGLAASRAHPGIYWTHNDSDDGAYIYAVDSRTGETVATVTMTGVGSPRDVEAISLGPDGDLYVGDIGDNLGGTWDHVWIYRFPEPKQLRDTTVKATQYVVKYDGGARDAEALMVHPKTGRAYIADKKKGGEGGLYEGPRQLSASGVNVFRRISDIDLWTTDGAFSPDGERLLLRSYFGAERYAWRGDRPEHLGRADVPFQRQGESVTYAPDGKDLMYGSEGARSRVEPIPVPGAESGADAGDQHNSASGGGSSSSESAGEGASAAKSGSGSGSDEGRAGGDSGLSGFESGGIALAVVVAGILGLKRLLRRG